MLTIFDVMVLVAAAAFGTWGAAAYRTGIPVPIIARPGLFPLLLSVPVAAALTCGFVAVPARTLRERTRRLSREPGTALCAAAAVALLGVVIRWSLRAWVTPYVDGTVWIYGAQVLYQAGAWCGLAVMASMAPLILSRRFRHPVGWIECMRLALAVYWLTLFIIFSVL
jgi:hypothetical protein